MDGGCVIAGYSNAPVIENHGGEDIVLYKLDKNFNYQWHKYYGTTQNDQPRCIKQTTDGGFIVTGFTKRALLHTARKVNCILRAGKVEISPQKVVLLPSKLPVK